MEHKDEPNGEVKSFMLRAIPIDIHKKLKLIAGLVDLSMEDFIMRAIIHEINKVLEEKRAEILKNG